MKIELKAVKTIPENFEKQGFCVYGNLSENLQAWCDYWKIEVEQNGKYTNMYVPEHLSLEDIFDSPTTYQYLDGFSPNLNKHLHLGHGANLVVGKALISLGIAKQTVAILGDTLTGTVSKQDALDTYQSICSEFAYPVDKLLFASGMVSPTQDAALEPGVDEYTNCGVFNINGVKTVGRKSDNSTTYFYQDMVLAEQLNEPTLYITGVEQSAHFKLLKQVYPHIKHTGLGLVTSKGEKMSSRQGNVIFFDDILTEISDKFSGDRKLAYNVLAGQILKYDLPTHKNIDMEQITNLQSSFGLYLSYTRARLVRAGIPTTTKNEFVTQKMQYAYLLAKTNLEPHQLLKAAYKLCTELNNLYNTVRIKEHPENIPVFQTKLSDLENAMLRLGMFLCDNV